MSNAAALRSLSHVTAVHSILVLALISAPSKTVLASPPTNPASVTIAGNLQSELGCSGDWQPDCGNTHLAYDANDDVWQATWTVPAGSWEYKAALDDSWNENYGLHAVAGGGNIPFNLGAPSAVKFYYDHKSNWVTDSKSSVIVTAPGSFQSELGCLGDWDPGCLRSWLLDPDGDGIYTMETTALPAGNYEVKAALNESWDVNYGQGGAQNGANISFSVPTQNAKVTFSYSSGTHVLTVRSSFALDNDVDWTGLRHDSRDPAYRVPGGAVPAGTPVTLRFRTFHNDVSSVKMRVYSVSSGSALHYDMGIVAADVPCLDPAFDGETCDFWSVTLPDTTPDNLWYRFMVSDGTDTDYYADDTPALDGGVGATTDEQVDQSYALTVYDPAYTVPSWAKGAIFYQVFPDRFRSGRGDNDPHTGDLRYEDPVLKLPWNTKPEGYCRNYADADSNCPWRFDPSPPDWSPTKEAPRGRDYMGGDLKGIDQNLGYLQSLGVTALYLNPIFDSASNHGYDTQDYLKVDPYFGPQKDWENLAKHAHQRGVRVLLDGVFNHMSSDSPFFDRYQAFRTMGACESASSTYRDWFFFRPPTGSEPAPCVPSSPGNDTYYTGWFGFDSIPVLNKEKLAVQQYFLTGAGSVSRSWLTQGAAGWRLDVMGDTSFPAGYWEQFRQVVKSANPDSLIIGELWQKDSTLLRNLRGDRADSTMNYRLRDAVIGLLAPGAFDSKGFADSGHSISMSQFAARLQSIREDYPDPAYSSLLNLLDSHDTERLLWTLTPGTETTSDKEANPSNMTEGKTRLRLASLVQFFVPGAPTIYYGDEIGMTGDDDPDNRRTYPWPDLGGSVDNSLFTHYQTLTTVRKQNPALSAGDFRVLFADDDSETVALGRKTGNRAAILLLNRGRQALTMQVPVTGYIPNGITFSGVYGVENAWKGISATTTGGMLQVNLNGLSGILLSTGTVDLNPPPAPVNLRATSEGNGQVALAWNSTAGAAGYNVYRSYLSGGGWFKVNAAAVTGTTFADSGLRNAVGHFYVVRAFDSVGNESGPSNEILAVPHFTIGWANLQWPPSMAHTISVINRTSNAYGQIWIADVTNQPGATATLSSQLGFGPAGSNPAANPSWNWIDASFNVDSGDNDEYVASLLPESTGNFDYLYRYSTTAGRDWLYADLNGPIAAGALPSNPGKLTVNASGDTTPPATPGNLVMVSASNLDIQLAWDAVTGDATLYGYEVLRGDALGGPFAIIARVTLNGFIDSSVVENRKYWYEVRAVDSSFNRSNPAGPVSAIAELRTVTVVFNVTVPATTDGTGRSVYIAGSLSGLDGNLPDWNPGAAELTRVDATHWTITLTGKEGTQIEYKYALVDWDHVEKDDACGEISNRQLTLTYGGTGTQTVNDTVSNWRNISPCGN